jgi:tetraacyldisaccharide 4'-kinase
VRCLPDHDPLSAGTLLQEFDLETPLLVTAKDWVKLRERDDLGGRTVLTAAYDVSVEPREAFVEWMRSKLDGLAGQTTA